MQAITARKETGASAMLFFRIFFLIVCLTAFMPQINPARLSGRINENLSLFSCATSPSSVTGDFVRARNNGWIDYSAVTLTITGSVVGFIAIVGVAAALCLTFGNGRMRRLGAVFAAVSGLIGIGGMGILIIAHGIYQNTINPDHINPMWPAGLTIFIVVFALTIIVAAVLFFIVPKPEPDTPYEMEPKYRLFMMILPFMALVVLFAYLPLYGWRYAFYDYRPGFPLTSDNFVGFKWFRFLFENAATRADIVRVMRNTFAMSGLGLLTSWLPMIFAVCLAEIKIDGSKRLVQTLTTIPNFISWVLVYSVAFAIFSSEGFLNWMLLNLGLIEEGTNWLMSGDNIWIKMWAWGTWKGLGWGAIVYLASISSIDPELYEAATVDGADRFDKMRYITIPGLTSTYFVLLLLSIASILSNGLDQYLVFDNPANRSTIQVLDLYVYQIGLGGSSSTSSIPLATVIGMFKSVISVALLFIANNASKKLRGESIV